MAGSSAVHRHIFATYVWTVSSLYGTEAKRLINDSYFDAHPRTCRHMGGRVVASWKHA